MLYRCDSFRSNVQTPGMLKHATGPVLVVFGFLSGNLKSHLFIRRITYRSFHPSAGSTVTLRSRSGFTHPCADSSDPRVHAAFLHFHSKTEREEGRDAPNSDLRRIETRRGAADQDPLWRYQMSSTLLQRGSTSTTQPGRSFCLAHRQQIVT